MTIRLVIFDLDDTLWKTGPTIHRAEQEMFAWAHRQDRRFKDIYIAHRVEFYNAIARDRPEIVHDVSLVRIALLARTFEASGKSEAEAMSLAQSAFNVFQDWRNNVELFDGVSEVLSALQESYVLASLTNGNAQVEKTPLAECFEVNLSAASVGAQKPDPRMFVAALESVGAKPRETVHVGDHPVDDVAGARKAGLYAVQVDYGMRELSDDAHATVSDLRQLADVIASLTD